MIATSSQRGGDGRPLTEKELRFCREYASNGQNATQAYLRAFPAATSYDAARKAASELLTLPHVKREIDAARKEYLKATRITATKLLKSVAEVAFFDPDDVLEPDEENGGQPKPKPWGKIKPSARRAIKEVKIKRKRLKCKNRPHSDDCPQFVEEIEDVEYKFHDVEVAKEKLFRYLGLSKDGAGLEKLLELLAEERTATEPGAGSPHSAGGDGQGNPGDASTR